MKLRWSEVMGLAHAAGWRGKSVIRATAVAAAESALDTEAFNDDNANGSTDTGLWQVNSVHGYPVRKLKQPLYNANAAFGIWLNAGRSFRPWYAYGSARYAAYYALAAGLYALGRWRRFTSREYWLAIDGGIAALS